MCQDALEVYRRHISADLVHLHAELEVRFKTMETTLNPLVGDVRTRE